jgi:hypothetical protein
MNFMKMTKFIYKVKGHQRMEFASAYVATILLESMKYLYAVTELLQKPCDLELMADTVEDRSICEELKQLNVSARVIIVLNPTHE